MKKAKRTKPPPPPVPTAIAERDYAKLLATVSELAGSIHALQQQAVRAYTPVVADIVRTHSRDRHHIEHTLDGLLDFCGYAPAVQLFKQLCRYYYYLDPAATAEYVYLYRDLWDSEERKDDAAE